MHVLNLLTTVIPFLLLAVSPAAAPEAGLSLLRSKVLTCHLDASESLSCDSHSQFMIFLSHCWKTPPLWSKSSAVV